MSPALRTLIYRLSGWPRRVLALLLLLVAVGAAFGHRAASSTDSRPAQPTVVAARDLPAGATLAGGDLTLASWASALRPANALTSTAAAIGHRLSGPLLAREAVTSTRLIGASLTDGLPAGLSATTVALPDPATTGLIHAGDAIDLFVGGGSVGGGSVGGGSVGGADTSAARLLAENVRVLAVLPAPEGGTGVPVIIAIDRSTAMSIASASGSALLATVRGSP